MRKPILLGTLLVLIFSFVPVADAYQAKWLDRKFTLKYDVKVPQVGKFKAREKKWDVPITLDSSFGTKIVWKIGTAVDAPTIEATVEGKNDKKANVTVVTKEQVETFVEGMNAFFDSQNQEKNKKLDYVPVSFDEIKAKGKLNVTGKYTKCSCKLKIKYTGTVKSGEHAGKAVKGSLQLIYKGDRE